MNRCCPVCGEHRDHDHHHDHEHEHEHECEHHGHEHHHEHEHECEHHDHDHDHEHEHHHEHGHDGCCEHEHGHDGEHHHHHHHADDVFTSWGVETARKYTAEEIKAALESLSDTEAFGTVLRAKGIVAGKDGEWIHFDYVPGEPDVRCGAADVTGRLCVIGSNIDKAALAKLFSAAE